VVVETPAPKAAEEGGAKIGEAGVDGRIATLVGYGPRPGSVARRPRRSPAAGPGAQQAAPAAAPEPPSAPVPAAPLGAAAPPRVVPLAKPPVRKLARDLGVDLRAVVPSAADGVITRADVQAHVLPVPAAAPAAPVGTGVRREPIRGVRKATAAAMVTSAFTAPHVTEFLTVDVTETMALRERLRATPMFADVKLTPLAFVAKAMCLAARRTPEVNTHWDGAAEEIVFYDRVQLGIAAATPRGLIVPKIREADTLGLHGLAVALGALTATAREGKTPPADLVGGTMTITNVGVFGVDTGTPILNPGEAVILAVGSIKQAPWVVDGALAVRTVCQLALSFDHRLVDGEQGSRFLADVGKLLEDPGLALTY
jgi:pyruvate dehydrogenase E2 component (dihydrolipoamide acetyltransferase)